MNKNTLLTFCRYFKGQEHNPYTGKDQNKAMLWFYEQTWVHDMQIETDTAIDEAINEYVRAGLGNFKHTDDVPVALKAYLFSRYAKHSNSMADAVEPFKKFYTEYYG